GDAGHARSTDAEHVHALHAPHRRVGDALVRQVLACGTHAAAPMICSTIDVVAFGQARLRAASAIVISRARSDSSVSSVCASFSTERSASWIRIAAPALARYSALRVW